MDALRRNQPRAGEVSGVARRFDLDTGEFSMLRKARAVWRGNGRAGNDDLSTDSGVLAGTRYSLRTRVSALTLRASVPNMDQDNFARYP